MHPFGCRSRLTLVVFVKYLPIRPVNKIQIVLTFESRLDEFEIGLPVNSKVCQIAILKERFKIKYKSQAPYQRL